LITDHIKENPTNHLLLNKDKVTSVPIVSDLEIPKMTNVEPLVRKRKIVEIDDINYYIYNKRNACKKKISITRNGKEFTKTYTDANFQEILENIKSQYTPFILKGNNWN
jgi:hypothetical protein